MMPNYPSRAERRRENKAEKNKRDKEKRREQKRLTQQKKQPRKGSAWLNRNNISFVLALLLPAAVFLTLALHYIAPHIYNARDNTILKVLFDNTGELCLLSASTFFVLRLLEQSQQRESSSILTGKVMVLELLGICLGYAGAAAILDTEEVVLTLAVLLSAASVILKWTTLVNWSWRPETLLGWVRLLLLIDILVLTTIFIISKTITGLALVYRFGIGVTDTLWTVAFIAIIALLGLSVLAIGLVYYPRRQF